MCKTLEATVSKLAGTLSPLPETGVLVRSAYYPLPHGYSELDCSKPMNIRNLRLLVLLTASAALLPSAVMLGFTTLFGAVAVWRFRWDE